MKTLTTVLLILTVVGCQPAYADLSQKKPPQVEKEHWSDALDRELRVGLLGWSTHYGGGSDNITNESHNIVAIEYMGWSAGKFDNSYGRETWFIAKNWRWDNLYGFKGLNGIASLGVNKGYRTCYGDDNSNSNFCAHGYVGVEYEKEVLVHSLKLQPGVILYNPEVKIGW